MNTAPKTIAIFTTTRAEFSAFKPLLKELQNSKSLAFSLFVGGAHLSPELGLTINEIRSAGFPIADTFNYLQAGAVTAKRLMLDMAAESQELARIFSQHKFDLVCIAGDRYELVPIALAATLFRCPILHLYGGESTEGVIDEQIRHMLTKAAHIHFTSCAEHSHNVQGMGENPKLVFTTGELVTDTMAQIETFTKKDLFSEFGLEENKPTMILTYHPVTLEMGLSVTEQMNNIFEALRKFDLQIIISAPNVEVGAQDVLAAIHKQVSQNKNYRYCESLGAKKFYNFLRYSQAIIGNSSSGLLEAPFFKIPSVNIGDRQKGRIRHESIIEASYSVSSIADGIQKALDPNFSAKLTKMKFKLGDGHAAEKMVHILEGLSIDSSLLKKKLILPT